MPDLTSLNQVTGAALGVGALIGLIVGWARVVHPRWKDLTTKIGGIFDAILGRDEIRDRATGALLVPAQDGIAVRQDRSEQQVELLTIAVTKLVTQQEHQLALEHRVEGVEGRVAALEEGSVERVVARAESAAAWRAMEAATLATPDAVVDGD